MSAENMILKMSLWAMKEGGDFTKIRQINELAILALAGGVPKQEVERLAIRELNNLILRH